MAMPAENAKALLEKIQSLPAERIAEVEDFVDFLAQRTRKKESCDSDRDLSDFPVISVEEWPEDLSLRREDMYGDDGR